VLGGAVVAVAAALLLTLIALARRIVRQAGEIEEAIDGARENTAALFDLSSVNLSLDQVTRELRAVRESR
jgi:membrane-associated phospholipid phosphatase